MTAAVLKRFGDAVDAVIFYGSCLRKGDLLEGVADLYVIVSSYRRAYPGRGTAALAAFLPPTVGYLELDSSRGILRAKYAVVSKRDFRRGTCGQWFHPYLWGRFSQPCLLSHVRGEAEETAVAECLAGACRTLMRRTLATAEMPAHAAGIWTNALGLSYGTELRPESRDRARDLVEADLAYYQAVTAALAPELGLAVAGNPSAGVTYTARVPGWRARSARIAWAVRRFSGKLLSPLRWMKALATFEGGLDYAAWKLERHSGKRIEVPERVRRRPWLHIWGELWRLYRSGVLR